MSLLVRALLSLFAGPVLAASPLDAGLVDAGMPDAGAPIAAPPPVVFVGAGDIATCQEQDDEATAQVVERVLAGGPATQRLAFTTGDNVYGSGSAEEYRRCYAPSWGKFRDRTRPTPGNHDYRTGGAKGYFDYFGKAVGDPAKGGFYSFDFGAWHIVALDSNVPMEPTSPQVRWLKEDLARSKARCTLAYWHHPRFSSGPHGDELQVSPLWEVLYQAGADVVLNGHDHHYERFAPQSPSGAADPRRGLRQFIVGSGGAPLYTLAAARPNSEKRNNTAFGVLQLTLRADGYDWEFLSAGGQRFEDKGSGACH